MATLDDLLEITGVVGAFEFTPDGRLLYCKAREDAPPEVAARCGEFCEIVTMLFNTDPGPFTALGEGERPPRGCWGCPALDWLVVTGHNRGVFAEGHRARVEELIRAVTGTPPQTI